MWSGPRNVSTALMYSFAQRGDTRVVDEPFYAHYLAQSGVKHPGRAKVLANQNRDARTVFDNLLNSRAEKEILFLKNMAHHMIGMQEVLDELIAGFQHIFLIRNPKDMILSLDKTLANPTLSDTAYQRQFELFERVQARDLPLLVIDAQELLKDPEYVLGVLCEGLGIEFEDSMLAWEAGPIPEDGVWAEHWYDGVHQSTGFNAYKPKEEPLPDRLKPLHEECKPFYDRMFVHAIKVN